MLLTITNTQSPATDLSFLLHKHPARVQSFDLSFGKAHVFYTEADDARCTAALLLDVDVVGLVRNRNVASGEGTLRQYVNDRPYVASSFMSVAMGRVFGTAMSGKCQPQPELPARKLNLEARLSVVPCRGGESFLRTLFEPLGYELEAVSHNLDAQFVKWGTSDYFTVTLRGEKTLQELLSHLYVLIPVLDNQKHYWMSDDEVEKLLRHGAAWLAAHPAKDDITRRYFKRRHSLVREALARLAKDESLETSSEDQAAPDREEAAIERPLSLNVQRLNAVFAALKAAGAQRVIDLGCGEGKLLRLLLEDRSFTEIVGMDVSIRALEIAHERLNIDRLPTMQRERVKLIHGSLMYRDKRLTGFDAAAIVEVVEHLDAPRLAAFERAVFEFARPANVILTTPNREYNQLFETLPAGAFRHRDHRFEWTRNEFQAWAKKNAARFNYTTRFLPIGAEDATHGAPTQMCIFTKAEVEPQRQLQHLTESINS